MKLKSVTYGYKRQPRQFESEHLEVTIEAEEGDTADEVLEKARVFVLSRLYGAGDVEEGTDIGEEQAPHEPTDEEIKELEEHYQIVDPEDYP